VNLVVLPLFALANAGVDLRHFDLSASGAALVFVGVLLARVVGKPAGVWADPSRARNGHERRVHRPVADRSCWFRGGCAGRRRDRGTARGDGRRLRTYGGVAGPGTGRLTTIVVPPPGVSSTVRSPPTASTKPFATARPSPTPAPFGLSPRRWNGRNTRSRSSLGMPGPVSITRRSTLSPTWPAMTRTGIPTGAWRTPFSTRLATARSRSAGSTSMRGSVSGTSVSTALSDAPRLDTAPATTSSNPTGRGEIGKDPV